MLHSSNYECYDEEDKTDFKQTHEISLSIDLLLVLLELQGAHSGHGDIWNHVWEKVAEKEAHLVCGRAEGLCWKGRGLCSTLRCWERPWFGVWGHRSQVSECLLEIMKICSSVLTTETRYSPVFLANMASISWHEAISFSHHCRDEAREEIFKKGQSKRIWGELYKVGITISQHLTLLIESSNKNRSWCHILKWTMLFAGYRLFRRHYPGARCSGPYGHSIPEHWVLPEEGEILEKPHLIIFV